MMVFVRRILLVLSLLFALGWFIPDGSGSHDFGKDTIAAWQDGKFMDEHGNGTYWQFGKRFMFEYVRQSLPDSGKAGKGLGFMGDHRSVWLNYEAGSFTILIEGYWLEIAACLGAFPLLYWARGWTSRRSAGRGFPVD